MTEPTAATASGSAMDHPLKNSSSSSIPSPPLSPSDLNHEANAFPQPTPMNLVTSPDLAERYGYISDQTAMQRTESHDPLLLKDRILTEEHLTEVRKRRTGKTLDSFYRRQNGQITSLLKPMDQHIIEAAEEEDANRLAIKIAIYGSLGANCVLAVLQIYAAVSSLSLSFFATALDSVFDPAANYILNYCHRAGARADPVKFPSGGAKFETIGEIVYGSAMLAVSIVLVAFSIQDLTKGSQEKGFHVPAVIAVGIAFITKLILFIYCYSIRSKNTQVRVLWEDHRNDLFINGFGIFTSAAGSKIVWWIDPAGALAISAVLIFVWGKTCKRLFSYLAGVAAPIEFQQLVIYKAMMFADSIEKIDSCSVYHSGSNYVVEIDIVMNGETPLWKAHDVSQALQDKMEEMPNVDRCFCHVDFEVSHKPEHRKKKDA